MISANKIQRKRRPSKKGRQNARRWALRTLIQKHQGLCALCGCQVELHDEFSPRYATIDHVIPISKGGADTIGNTQLACHACNQAKGSSVEAER